MDGGSLYPGVLVLHALLIAVEDLVFLSSVGDHTKKKKKKKKKKPVEDLVQHVTTMHHPATHYAYGVDLLPASHAYIAAMMHRGYQVTCDDLVVTWGPQ